MIDIGRLLPSPAPEMGVLARRVRPYLNPASHQSVPAAQHIHVDLDAHSTV